MSSQPAIKAAFTPFMSANVFAKKNGINRNRLCQFIRDKMPDMARISQGRHGSYLVDQTSQNQILQQFPNWLVDFEKAMSERRASKATKRQSSQVKASALTRIERKLDLLLSQLGVKATD